MSDFDTKLKTFVEAIQAKIDAHKTSLGIDREILELRPGKKYVKIVSVREGSKGGSAFAFIDKATGDVLKPASWAAPAKHARGNIFDESNGTKHVGVYGPAYLR